MKFYPLFLVFISFALNAQNIPINFEENGNGADWTWTVFENQDNPNLEIIDNPEPNGINTSSKVAKFTARQSGQPFAGCESLHGSDIGTFTIGTDNAIIRIMVWKSVISDVGIKLVREDGWSLGEIKIPNTKINEWEMIEFDFAAHIGNEYDQIVIFPDFANRTSENVIYFDNVYGDISTSISNAAEAAIKFNIFPNPTSNMINISSNAPIDGYVLYSLEGQVMTKGSAFSKAHEIDVAEIPSGIYLLEIYSQKGRETHRLILN